jgi:hypothetical protein
VLTVAALDDVLYADEAVVAFSAAVDRGAAGDRLKIEVEARKGHPGDLPERLAVQLASLLSLSSGQVEISVRVSTTAVTSSPAAKQRIDDSRRAA